VSDGFTSRLNITEKACVQRILYMKALETLNDREVDVKNYPT